MNTVLYWLLRTMVAVIQALPLRLVARLGRAVGAVAYILGGRYRHLVRESLALCFPEKSSDEILQLAKENFRRIFENYACCIKTAGMSPEELRPHLECAGEEQLLPRLRPGSKPQSMVVAVGHFGNFELYARLSQLVPPYQGLVTYRGLNQPALDRILSLLRSSSGCRYFERRQDIAALKAAMSEDGLMLGLLADQHSVTGLRLPFFGRECSTSTAPAVFATRYKWPLHTAICYRTGLAQWRIELDEEIPTEIQGQPRSVGDITLDVNRAFEKAIRRDPANWFWVHRRWKPPGKRVKRMVDGKVVKSRNPV